MRFKFAKPETELVLFRNMVRKLVPDFDDKEQYVLWLVPDFWDERILYDVEGTVRLYDSEDNEIDVTPFGLEGTEYLTRKPYYNKGIRQIGLKKGRGRVYGIPLVFSDYHDMLKISTIKLHWEVMMPIFFSDASEEPYYVRPITMDIVYHVNFDVREIENNHWFTLSYQDKFFDDNGEKIRKDIREYYDIGMCVFNYHVIRGIDEDETDIIYDLCEVVAMDDREGALNKKEVEIVSMLDVQPFDGLVEKARKMEQQHFSKEHNRLSCEWNIGEWDIDRYYYEKTITLTADPYADIIPEKGFGF